MYTWGVALYCRDFGEGPWGEKDFTEEVDGILNGENWERPYKFGKLAGNFQAMLVRKINLS